MTGVSRSLDMPDHGEFEESAEFVISPIS